MKKSESPEETQILDSILRLLESQWTIPETKIVDKREQFLRVLREVGRVRLQQAILHTIDDYQGDFCPPLSFIRTRIPARSPSAVKVHQCNQCISGWIYASRDEYNNRQVVHCPNYKNPQYLVAENSSITEEMRADKAAHPENWWGWHELKAVALENLRRVQAGQSRLVSNSAEEDAFVAAFRKNPAAYRIDLRTKQSVADAWAKWQKPQGMEKWTWNS